MRTYAMLLGAMAGVLLAGFAVVEALGVPLLGDPRPFLDRAGTGGAAALAVGLLTADVVLPVPASLVMIADGALFGLWLGSLVSLAGGLGAAALGFALGRWGRVPVHRLVGDEERRRADALLERWGALAVVASRPVPIVAESVAVLAGTSPLGWARFLAAATLGNLPAAILLAATGATAARLDSALLVFALVLAVAGVVWLVGRRLGVRSRVDSI